MSDLTNIVDSLESSVHMLLERQGELRAVNQDLANKIDVLNRRNSQYEKEISIWKEKCHSLKHANSLLGSDEYKRETKLKINALIREIDQCIVHLSE